MFTKNYDAQLSFKIWQFFLLMELNLICELILKI